MAQSIVSDFTITTICHPLVNKKHKHKQKKKIGDQNRPKHHAKISFGPPKNERGSRPQRPIRIQPIALSRPPRRAPRQQPAMLLQLIGARIRSLLLLLLAIVNRALCCFSRKRRNSFSDCEVVLQSVSVGADQQSSFGGGSRKRDNVSSSCSIQCSATSSKKQVVEI